jgi:hypothetical protein
MIMTNSQLAKRVIRQVRALTPKLKELEADLRRLWVAFEKLPKGEKILGCRTKAQFCEKKLRRTPRAIQHLLYGRTTEQRIERAGEFAVERANIVRIPTQEILSPNPGAVADLPTLATLPKKAPVELTADDAATVAKKEAMHRMVAYLDRFEGQEFETKLDEFVKDLRRRCARRMGASA